MVADADQAAGFAINQVDRSSCSCSRGKLLMLEPSNVVVHAEASTEPPSRDIGSLAGSRAVGGEENQQCHILLDFEERVIRSGPYV